MRIFLGLPILANTRKLISNSIAELQKQYAQDMRFLSPRDYHITLHFLGGLDVPQIINLVQALRPIINKHKNFPIEFDKFTVFPDQQGHCWVLTVKENAQLQALYQDVGEVLLQQKLRVDKRGYYPHTTIAKKPRSSLMPSVDFPQINFPPMPAARLLLYVSQQSQAGSCYQALEYFHLLT